MKGFQKGLSLYKDRSARLQGKGGTSEHTINFVGASKGRDVLSWYIAKEGAPSLTLRYWPRMVVEELLRLNWPSREAIVADGRLEL